MLVHNHGRKKLTPAEREKKRAEKEARMKRDWEAVRPKPSPLYQGMAEGLQNAFRPDLQAMAEGLRGVTDLTDESHRPIDLTNVPPSIDCGTFTEAKTPAEPEPKPTENTESDTPQLSITDLIA